MINTLSNIVNAMLVSQIALCERLIKPTPAWSTRLQPRTTLNEKPPPLSTPRMTHPARPSVSLPSIKTFLPRKHPPLPYHHLIATFPPPPPSS